MSEFWSKCLDELRNSGISSSIYKTWFESLKLREWNPTESRLTLEAANSAKARTTKDSYGTTIAGIATNIHGHPVEIDIKAGADLAVDATTPQEVPVIEELRREDTGLLPGLTFENYVAGSSNALAVAAAEHVAATAGGQYNPLYIYGGVGLGKTHLMQAIGHRYLDLHPKAKVRCVSAQDFISEFTAIVREPPARQQALFRQFEERYKSVDLLLIDDVQSFSGAKSSQGQFFAAFQALVPHNKQVVLTSDTYAKGLRDIEPRLVSRFTQGLSVAIEPPELEMRIAILLNKANAMGANLPDEVAAFIAKRLKSNVRELEGALQQVIAYQQFQPSADKEITIDVAKRVLRDQFSAIYSMVTIENIQKTVADYYNIKIADMYSKRRPANIALPRQIAMYLSKELTQSSLPEIGDNFGGRDHTTVLHAVRKIAKERQNNAELNHELHVLEQMIKG